jgi:predicted secreted Zn-dependent protease
MTYSIRSNLAMEGGMCRAANYNVNLNFVISLPKLASAGPSSAQAASAWKQFQSFVTTHEHHHRDLWTGCRDTHVLQARKTSARSCKQLADKLGTMWSKAQDTCQGYHAAFDRAQRAPLLAQPLIRAALR